MTRGGSEPDPAASSGGAQGPLVLVSVEGVIGTLTLNRPEKLNAFFGAMRDDIADGLEELGRRDDVRVVIVTGAGRAFCAGADVAYLDELLEREAHDEARLLVEAGRRVVHTIAEMPKPVIAALNGPAAGGGANLALACDLRIASERASIGQTFNRIGLHPDWGGTYHVPRLVGPARAAELFFLADMIDAREAERIGLVNRVVPHDRLMEEARALARRLARKPALSLRLAKEAIRRSASASLEEMLDFEVRAQVRCFESADAREGVRAFLEKRQPNFGDVDD
ncbi:MAG: enoyl-CoA hydratase/isomerase family protein [Gemmatimonadota bacterium]